MTKATPEENIGNVSQTPVIIHKQYLKDLSFENPNAPLILKKADNRPEMDMNIMIDVQKIEDEELEHLYEVTLNITASAKRKDQTMFIAEILYGAAVSISGLDEKKHHPLLFIEVPYMLFPFVRQILANATQAGGFMPLQLSPVDFRSMYLKRFASKEKEANQSTEDKKTPKTA